MGKIQGTGKFLRQSHACSHLCRMSTSSSMLWSRCGHPIISPHQEGPGTRAFQWARGQVSSQDEPLWSKLAVRVKLAPASFLGTETEENPTYPGQAHLKQTPAKQVWGHVLSEAVCPRANQTGQVSPWSFLGSRPACCWRGHCSQPALPGRPGGLACWLH